MLNEFNCGDVYIRHAIDEHPEKADCSMHIHTRCEIYFFVSGRIDYLVEGSRYQLEPDSIMIMRPRESHAAQIMEEERYERYAINFPIDFMGESDGKNLLARPFLERDLGKGNLFTENDMDVRLAKRIFTEMSEMQDSYTRELAIRTELPSLLYLIYKAFLERNGREANPPGKAQRVARYINEHLFDELTVTTLSRHFNLSESQFTRIFKRDIGSPPWEYILRKRLTAARELLKKGSPTQEAAESCAFQDYSSFYRAYVKYFRESPGQTRKTHPTRDCRIKYGNDNESSTAMTLYDVRQ